MCSTHERLNRQFQKYSGGFNEVKRYLPRLSLKNVSMKSVSDVLQASSLMSELENGKLEKTIDGFCRKAANAARPRKRREGRSVSIETKTRQLEEISEKISLEIELCKRVLMVESKVSEELRRFAEFGKCFLHSKLFVAVENQPTFCVGIFPADELAEIREEYTILNRDREAISRVVEGKSRDEGVFSGLPSLKKETLRQQQQQQIKTSTLNQNSPTKSIKQDKYLLKNFDTIMQTTTNPTLLGNKFVLTQDLPPDR